MVVPGPSLPRTRRVLSPVAAIEWRRGSCVIRQITRPLTLAREEREGRVDWGRGLSGHLLRFEVLTGDGGAVAAGEGPVVVLKRAGLVRGGRLHISPGGGPQRVQLRGELALRLDEGAAVVPHRLIPGVGVLRHDRVDGRDEHEDQEEQREDGVVDEEDDAHDARDEARLVEDVGEEEHEDGVEEVHGGDGDVPDVGLLVHPGAQDADGDEHGGFEDDEGHGLHHRGRLGQADEHALDEDVAEGGDDKVVGGGPVLHVEEPPLVEAGGIGVEDVGGVLVHGDGALGQVDHLEGGPAESGQHRDEHDDGQDHLGGGVDLGELPQAEDAHLGEADEGQAEEDAAGDDLPALAEVLELVALHLALLDEEFADALEEGDEDHDDEDEEDEEDETGEEDVGLFDAGPEAHALDAADDEVIGGGGGRLRAGALEQVVRRPAEQTGRGIEGSLAALEDLHGRGRQFRQDGGGGPAGGALVPGADGLEEAHVDDAHTPLEILGPRGDNGRHVDGSHAEEGLGLHETEEGEGIGGHVGGSVGMAEAGGDGGGGQAKPGDDGGGPSDALLVDGLAVGQIRLDAGDTAAGVGGVDVDADRGVQVGNGVCDAGDLLDDILGDLDIGAGHVDGTGVHGTQAGQIHLTGVQFLADGFVAIGIEDEFGGDFAGDGGDAIEGEGEGSIVGGEGDTKIGGGEIAAVLTEVQGVGFDQFGRRHQRGGEEGDEKTKEK